MRVRLARLASARATATARTVRAASPDATELTPEFRAWLPSRLDVAYSSLMCEYLTTEQIVALALALWVRLSEGGVVALFEWGEHFSYTGSDLDGIAHPTGISKAAWLRIAARIAEAVEDAEGRLAREEAVRQAGARERVLRGGALGTSIPNEAVAAAAIAVAKFPMQPQHRVEVTCGTFPVTTAATQTVPSGDTVHYLVLKKVALAPAGAMPAQGATAAAREPGPCGGAGTFPQTAAVA